MSVIDLLDKGGPIAWILFGYSVVALAIVIERSIFFARLGRLPGNFESQIIGALRRGDADRVLAGATGPEARLMRALVQASGEGVQDLGRVGSRVGSEELQRMERGFRTLGIMGNTATLLGLFGTVTGMIKAFMVIESAGGRVDAQALAGGIWEAMITTGVGLAVALPILILLHTLEGMADRRAHAMRTYASLVLENLPHVPELDEGPVSHHSKAVADAV
ncbi:MAG: MotA/TolQ/ExbB proton channel family protein [Gammaproteobacteria bacterium]|nr:MotA/TolQ/ExbB proton channel family protein [Gammaproteobacteria bacterium]